jgi:hypothetical protein
MTETKTTYESKILGDEKDAVFSGLFDAVLESTEAPQPEADKLALAEKIKSSIEKTAERVDALVVFVKAHRQEAERLRELEQMIATRRRRIESACDAFESSVSVQMLEWGVKKVSGTAFELTMRKCPPSVEITNETLIPGDYIEYRPQISKTKIKEALQTGTEVPGAKLITDKQTLQMR